MSRRTRLVLICVAVLSAGLATGLFLGDDTIKTLRAPFVQTWRSWFTGSIEALEALRFAVDDDDKVQPSTPQSVLEHQESLYADYVQVAGRRTNFQHVITMSPESSIVRQSRGVARLDLIRKDRREATACTAFLISDDYALTAGHCFYRKGSCAGAPRSKDRLSFRKAMLVFGYYGREQRGTQGSEAEIAADPDPADIRCENGLDFALLKVDAAAIDAARKHPKPAIIHPVLIGEMKISGGHQLMILHHPDGRAQMVTERHCLAADDPDRDGGYFAHYCDTLAGSSGAPVFSRDHGVVIGLHLRSQIDPSSAGEENAALTITEIVANSPKLAELGLLHRNPPTAEQAIVIAEADRRAKQATDLVAAHKNTLAAIVAKEGLRLLMKDQPAAEARFLLSRAPGVEHALSSALKWLREIRTLDVRSPTLGFFTADSKYLISLAGDELVAFQAEDGQEIGRCTPKLPPLTTQGGALQPLRRRAWAATRDGTLLLVEQPGRLATIRLRLRELRGTGWCEAGAIFDLSSGTQVSQIVRRERELKVLLTLSASDPSAAGAPIAIPTGASMLTITATAFREEPSPRLKAYLQASRARLPFVNAFVVSPDFAMLAVNSLAPSAKGTPPKPNTLVLDLRSHEILETAKYGQLICLGPNGLFVVRDEAKLRVYRFRIGAASTEREYTDRLQYQPAATAVTCEIDPAETLILLGSSNPVLISLTGAPRMSVLQGHLPSFASDHDLPHLEDGAPLIGLTTEAICLRFMPCGFRLVDVRSPFVDRLHVSFDFASGAFLAVSNDQRRAAISLVRQVDLPFKEQGEPRLRLYDTESRSRVSLVGDRGEKNLLPALSDDGASLLLVDRDNGEAVVLDRTTSRWRNLAAAKFGKVQAVEYLPGGRAFVVLSDKGLLLSNDTDGRHDVVAEDAEVSLRRPLVTIGQDEVPRSVFRSRSTGKAHVVDMREPRRRVMLSGDAQHLLSPEFVPSGQLVLTRDAGGATYVWRIDTGDAFGRQPTPVRINSARSVGQGGVVLSVAGSHRRNQRVSVVSVLSGSVIRELDASETTFVDAAFSADGLHAATLTAAGRFRMWRASDFALTCTREIRGGGLRIVFSPDRRHVLAGSHERVVLLDVESCEEMQAETLSPWMLPPSPGGPTKVIPPNHAAWAPGLEYESPVSVVDAMWGGMRRAVGFSGAGSDIWIAEQSGYFVLPTQLRDAALQSEADRMTAHIRPDPWECEQFALAC